MSISNKSMRIYLASEKLLLHNEKGCLKENIHKLGRYITKKYPRNEIVGDQMSMVKERHMLIEYGEMKYS